MTAFATSLQLTRIEYARRQGRMLSNQRGATLLVGVIFLIVLTLLGISAASISALDERMARNLRDRNIAFQAAEAALRDARNDILKVRKLSGYTGASATCNGSGFKGLCLPAASGNQVWSDYFADSNSDKYIEYGEVTGLSTAQKFSLSPNLGGVTAQPRYLIEVLPDPNKKDSLKVGPIKVLYRITSIGYGSNDGTSVLLQEVIRP